MTEYKEERAEENYSYYSLADSLELEWSFSCYKDLLLCLFPFLYLTFIIFIITQGVPKTSSPSYFPHSSNHVRWVGLGVSERE